MTIYCWDGKHLAVDKEEYKLGVRVQRASKFISFSAEPYKKVYVVGSGTVSQVRQLMGLIKEFMSGTNSSSVSQAQEKFAELEKTFDEYDIVILTESHLGTRHLYNVGTGLTLNKITSAYAGGHGDTVLCALGALHAGADAETALKIASDLTLIAKITTSADYDVI